MLSFPFQPSSFPADFFIHELHLHECPRLSPFLLGLDICLCLVYDTLCVQTDSVGT